ncbi:HXXEE domain-containing protein [Loigolactobacillus binensis]|uniref:HXXEE domain-containing protein n=1 Tax=Loigolactobacillus binensis TaxID=2559922 RepID=A0ABW3EDF6_9LACO|nr:HXXEE domain-containing protein [Loigolactobacillus binensis]
MFFQTNVAWYFQIWPWIGLGGAISILILLFTTNILRSNFNQNRWLDPFWLAWLCNAAYLIHNVEEYGIDLTGRSYGFPQSIAELAGKAPGGMFFVAVNITMFWIAGPLAAVLARYKGSKMLASAMASIMFINAITHTLPAIITKSYDTGLLTALIIFFPITLWTYYVIFIRTNKNYRALCTSISLGLFYHIMLFVSILGLFKPGIAGTNIVALIMFFGAFLYVYLADFSNKLLYQQTD